MTKIAHCWAAKWVSPDHAYLLRQSGLPVLFKTRSEARAWVKKQYGYIATRKDLTGAPHFWRMPCVVRVKVEELA